ncbi:MAG: DUF2177 family protein [Reyranellaceae bacterium]
MKGAIIGYIAALVTIVALDALWLGIVARDFYQARLGQLLLDRPSWLPAVVFYLIHAVGITVFVLPSASTWLSAALLGALFGLCVYAAYDFTNLATVRGWPPVISFVDLAWGTIVTAAASIVAHLIVRRITS